MAEQINLSGHFDDGITPKLRVLKSALEGVNKLHRELVGIYKQLNKRIKEFKDVTTTLTKRLKLQNKTLRQTVSSLRDFKNELSGIDGIAMKASRSINRVSDSIRVLRRNIRGSDRELGRLKQKLSGFDGIRGIMSGRVGRSGFMSGYGQNVGYFGYGPKRIGNIPGNPYYANTGMHPSPMRPTPTVVVKPPRQSRITKDQGGGRGKGSKGPWSQNWGHAGSTFGHTMGHIAGHIMHSILSMTFRAGANLLSMALKGVWWAIMDGVQDEMSDIQSAGGMFAVDKRQSEDKRLFDNFTQARLFQEETNRLLARSAATLPGTTNEYVKASKRLTDSIMLAAVNNPDEFRQLAQDRGAGIRENERTQTREDISTLLAKFTEQSVLLGLGSSGRGTLSMDMILEQLLTREQISMGRMIRYAPMRDNPVLTSILTDNKDAINATKARSAQRLRIVMDVLEKALPREVINSMRASLEGVSEAYRSFLIDQDIGLFGLRRELKLMVVSTNSYGQFIDEQGKVVKSITEAAKVNTTVFRMLRDTISGFAIPLMELMPLISELWDPLESLANSFSELRRIGIIFQQRFTAYTNWFDNRDYQDSAMRGALGALNKLMFDYGALDENVAVGNAETLEDPYLRIESMANMFDDLIDRLFNSEIAYKFGALISGFIGRVFIALGETLYAVLDIIGGKDNKNKFAQGLVDGWKKLTSGIFNDFTENGRFKGGESAASKAIKYILEEFKNFLFWLVKGMLTNFPKETFTILALVLLLPAVISMIGTILAAVTLKILGAIGAMALAKVIGGGAVAAAGGITLGTGATVGYGAAMGIAAKSIAAGLSAAAVALAPVAAVAAAIAGGLMIILAIVRQKEAIGHWLMAIFIFLGDSLENWWYDLKLTFLDLILGIVRLVNLIPGINLDNTIKSLTQSKKDTQEAQTQNVKDAAADISTRSKAGKEAWGPRHAADTYSGRRALGMTLLGDERTSRLTVKEMKALELEEILHTQRFNLSPDEITKKQTEIDTLNSEAEKEIQNLVQLAGTLKKLRHIASDPIQSIQGIETSAYTPEEVADAKRRLPFGEELFENMVTNMFTRQTPTGRRPTVKARGVGQILGDEFGTRPSWHILPETGIAGTNTMGAGQQSENLVVTNLEDLLKNKEIISQLSGMKSEEHKKIQQIHKQLVEHGIQFTADQTDRLAKSIDSLMKTNSEAVENAIKDLTDNDGKVTEKTIKVLSQIVSTLPEVADDIFNRFIENQKDPQKSSGAASANDSIKKEYQKLIPADEFEERQRLGELSNNLLPLNSTLNSEELASAETLNPFSATGGLLTALNNAGKNIFSKLINPNVLQGIEIASQRNDTDSISEIDPTNPAIYYHNANNQAQNPIIVTVNNPSDAHVNENPSTQNPTTITNHFTINGAQDPEMIAEKVAQVVYEKMVDATYGSIG